MSWTHARARLATLSRLSPDDHAAIEDARRDYRAARLEDYIRKTISASPPLTHEQRDELADLIRGGGRIAC